MARYDGLCKAFLLNPPFQPKFSRAQRSPAVTKSGTLYYPIWLAYAAGVLEQEGHQVALVDAPARGLDRPAVLARAAELAPDLIVVDTSTPSIYNDAAIAGALKEQHPQAFVVLVGTHVSALPEDSLALDARIDAVARREYDWILRDVARALAAGQDPRTVAGLSFRNGDGTVAQNPDYALIQDLDTLPFAGQVYRRHLRIEDYFYAITRYPVISVITGRGCPHGCAFCVYPQTMHGRGYRLRSVESVLEEFRYIARELPQVREIFIEDDTLTVDRARCHALCQALSAAGLGLTWTANARADVDYETLVLMKQAGCRLLCVGFESGAQPVLDQMGKRITLERMLQFSQDARRAGILVHGCFIVGHPGDTWETVQQTLRWAKKLNPDTVQFYPLMVYPGTRAYRWVEEQGYLTTTDFGRWLTPEGLHNCVVDQPGLPAKELVSFCDQARRAFYLRPRYLVRKLAQVLTDREEARRTFKSLRTFARHLCAWKKA